MQDVYRLALRLSALMDWLFDGQMLGSSPQCHRLRTDPWSLT
jgi:hypothetical protein